MIQSLNPISFLKESAGNAEAENRMREQMKREKAEAFHSMIKQNAALIEKKNQASRLEAEAARRVCYLAVLV